MNTTVVGRELAAAGDRRRPCAWQSARHQNTDLKPFHDVLPAYIVRRVSERFGIMAIDGLIILDASGYALTVTQLREALANIRGSRAIIQSGFRSRSQAYPLLHIDALNNALEKAARPGDVDPVLYVSSLELDTPSACCHVKHGELRFLCPVSGDSA